MHQTMKRITITMLLCMVMLVAFLPNHAQAAEVASGECGENLTWILDDTGTLTISGSGPMTDYGSASAAPWYTHRASVIKIVIEDKVATIGDRAFYGFTALTDITIGKSIETIGTYAFRGCVKLESVTIPAGVTQLKDSAFRDCTALAEVTFDGNAPTIGNYVFNGCASGLTICYYEGNAGFDVAPWTGYTVKALHVGKWVVDTEPTCTMEGSKHIDCTYCKETITEAIPVSHTYVNEVCCVCNFPKGLQYSVNSNNTVTITGYTGNCSALNIPERIEGYPVTEIGYEAFAEFGHLTSITIPEGVTNIGVGAFYNCSSLSDISIPESVTSIDSWAFYGCIKLTDITIPEGVTSIGPNAFSGCSNLTGITIPEGVTSIAAGTFSDCSSLTDITIPESVTSIGDWAFSGCSSLTGIAIPESVTIIDGYAFYGCSGLTNITIPEGVTSIGNWTFYGCIKLTDITISDSVTSIGSWAFSGCSSLTGITIPKRMTRIADGTFNDCTSLKRVTISKGVTDIGESSFQNCSSLIEITIPDTVTDIDSWAFYGCSSLTEITIPKGVTSIGAHTFTCCRSLKRVTIPNTVTSIGESAFRICSSLTDITIPEGVKTIGNSAFEECTSLTGITIPDGIEEIGTRAFAWCSSLKTVVIGNGLFKICEYTFADCNSLTDITIPSSVTSFEEWAFHNCTGLTDIHISDLGAWINIKSTGEAGHPFSASGNEHKLFLNGKLLTHAVIPDGITVIRENAFANCTSLTAVTIPASVKSAEDGSFYNCKNLTDVYITDVAAWLNIDMHWDDRNPFSVYGYVENGQEYVSNKENKLYLNGNLVTNLIIPDGVTNIRYSAFASCSSIKSVTIPKSVTTIGVHAFINCDRITDVYYGGTKDQWKNISISYGNNALLDAAYHDASECANGHSYGSYVSDNNGRPNAQGTKTATCSKCGDSKTVADTGVYLPDVQMKTPNGHTSGNILYWETVEGATLYQVYRLDNGSWVLLKNTGSTAYKDETAPVGVKSYYKVRARKDNLMSSMAVASVVVTRPAPITKLDNVKISSINAHTSGNIIYWNAVANAKLYQVFRLENGSWKLLTNTGSTAYKDETAPVSVKTYYKIVARNGDIKSDIATTTSASATRPAVAITKLDNVTITSINAHKTGNIIYWNAVNNAKIYQVYRLENGSWVLLKNTGSTAYKDETAPVGVKCYYKIVARNGDIKSDIATTTSASAIRPKA